MVNEALNKLRRTTNDSSSSLLLIDHNDYTSAESSSFITNPSRSPPATLVAPVKQSAISNQSGCEKRAASDTQNLSSITSFTSGSNPSKRSKISSSSSSTSFSNTASTSKGTSSTENCRDSPFFDIHDKLRELYGLLYYNDEQNRRTETRVSFQRPFPVPQFYFIYGIHKRFTQRLSGRLNPLYKILYCFCGGSIIQRPFVCICQHWVFRCCPDVVGRYPTYVTLNDS